MLKELYNHRKRKEGLISLQNDLIGDIDRFLTDWEETEDSYLSLTIKTGGFKHNDSTKKDCPLCKGEMFRVDGLYYCKNKKCKHYRGNCEG